MIFVWICLGQWKQIGLTSSGQIINLKLSKSSGSGNSVPHVFGRLSSFISANKGLRKIIIRAHWDWSFSRWRRLRSRLTFLKSQLNLYDSIIYVPDKSTWSWEKNKRYTYWVVETFVPFVILSCAADAFFCVPDLGDSPSFFACFNENNLIMLGLWAWKLCKKAYKILGVIIYEYSNPVTYFRNRDKSQKKTT